MKQTFLLLFSFFFSSLYTTGQRPLKTLEHKRENNKLLLSINRKKAAFARQETRNLSRSDKTAHLTSFTEDQKHTILTWLGTYHGSTLQEAQQQYDEKDNERWKAKEEEEQEKEKAKEEEEQEQEQEKKRWGLETEEETVARHTQMYDDWKESHDTYYPEIYEWEVEEKKQADTLARISDDKVQILWEKQDAEQHLTQYRKWIEEQLLTTSNNAIESEEDAQWFEEWRQHEVKQQAKEDAQWYKEWRQHEVKEQEKQEGKIESIERQWFNARTDSPRFNLRD